MRSAEWILWFSRKMSEHCCSNFNLSMTDIFSRSAPSLYLGNLFHKTALTTYKGCLFVWWNKYLLLRAPQGQLPKQKHSPKVVLGSSCSGKLPIFDGLKHFMTLAKFCRALLNNVFWINSYGETKIICCSTGPTNSILSKNKKILFQNFG